MSTTQTPGLAPTFYTLNDVNGTFEKVTITRQVVADADAQLRALSNDQCLFIPRACSVGRQPVHVAASAHLLTMACRLPNLRLSTFWKIIQPPDRRHKPYIVPIFHDAGSGEFRAAPVWTPYSNMAMFFVSCFQTSNGQYVYSRSNIAVVCTDKRYPGTYRFPLPNIHGNGKLCLGSDAGQITADATLPLASMFDKALEVFQSSPWNTDLLNENAPDVINAHFRFSAEDNKTQVPGPIEEWPISWVKISNTDFSAIPFHTLL